jgi:iron complex transport system substrate-binding protein
MRWPVTLLLALSACGTERAAVPHVAARPLRVMSVNLCTDQLLLQLLPPERIASVSWLARDPGSSTTTREAAAVAVNHGLAEEVLAQRPDLVVASSFGTPTLRAMLHRLGYPLVEIDDASDVAGIRRATRTLAAAVGEPARGEALIAAMDAKFAALARDPGSPIRIAAWDRSGVSAPRGTLHDAVLSATGARNVGAGERGSFDLEDLLRLRPAALVQAPRISASLGDDRAEHPVVRARWQGRRLTLHPSAYICGTPRIADAALAMRAELRRLYR